VEKGLSTQKVVVVPVASGLLQAEDIGESSSHLCKAYMETSPFSFWFFPRQHYLHPFYPLDLLVFLLLIYLFFLVIFGIS
jgi:hypothetical protein